MPIDGGDSKPDFMPNYGERLRRARLGLAVAMTPILMLFLSFSAVYLVRRGFISFDIGSGAFIRIWVPVRLPWLLLMANTLALISSSITIDFARRDAGSMAQRDGSRTCCDARDRALAAPSLSFDFRPRRKLWSGRIGVAASWPLAPHYAQEFVVFRI